MAKNIDLDTHRNQLISLYQAGKLTELEPICRLILKQDHSDANAMHFLGISLKKQGQRAAACDYFCRAADANPDNISFLKTAANELFALEKFEPAIDLFNKLLALGHDPVAMNNNIGFCYHGMRKLKNAMVYYRKALEIKPDNPQTLNNLGIILLEYGKKKIATTLFEKSIEIDPNFHQAYYHKHISVFNDKAPKNAINALQSALDANSQNYLAKTYLAMWLDFAGDSTTANTLFRQLESEVSGQLSFYEDSWQYVKANCTKNTRLFSLSFDCLRYAFSHTMNKGQILEFGVRQGNSINFISQQTNSPVHGFDSFEGLPEEWEGQDKGLYSTNSILPKVNSNVTLHEGWFEESLPTFCETDNAEQIRFLNVDCDIYSSTKTIFKNLGSRIVPGSVIIFDEYISNPNWRNDEYKAFQEFVKEYKIRYEYLLFSPFTKQAAVKIS